MIVKGNPHVDHTREIKRCRKDFLYFLKNYVYTLDSQAGRGKQRIPDWDYIDDFARALFDNRQVEVLKSRQMLISWILAAFLLHQTMFVQGAMSIAVSKGGRESREIGARSEFIYKSLPGWMRVPLKTNLQFGEYAFPGIDSKYMCLPADPDIGRTFSAGLIIFDEMAFFPWGSEIMGALGPILGSHGRFVGVSTPNGRDGLFYPTWHDSNTTVKKINLHWAQRPDQTEEWAERIRSSIGMTDQKWMREYEHSFAVPAGKPVYPTFSARQVIPDWRVHYAGQLILVMGWDRGYHRPATIWSFVNKKDQLVVCRSRMGEDISRDRYIPEIATETIAAFSQFKDKLSYVPPDFRLTESDGKNWEAVMKAHGFASISVGKAGKDEVRRRVDAVRGKLKLRADGEYGMLVDKSCETLIEGLAGGYTYPEVIKGPEDEKPLKDGFYDHEQNALEVICDNHFDILSGSKPVGRTIYATKRGPTMRQMKRAFS